MSGTVLSILMLAGFALSAGGIYLIAKRRDHKRSLLMIVAALVMFANVAIWQVPLN
jgi:LPXTG-motif cell wall-anchored protein